MRLLPCLFLASFCVSSGLALAQTPDPCATAPQSCATLIAAHATSRMRIPNTVVDISVAVTADGQDIPTVQRALTEHSNALLAYLRGQKVQRLMTSRVSFTPTTKYEKNGPNKTVGYSGASSVSFRSTPEKAAEILAGVLGNGANTIQSTRFMPTEEEIAAVRRELAADSTRTAIAQAESVAKAAGLKVVSVRKIDMDDSGTNVFGYVPQAAMVNSFDARSRLAAPMEAEAGDQEFSMRTDVVVAANR